MFAKLTELKGWITPCFDFMTYDDNFYDAEYGCAEFMITQDQKHCVHWITGAPQEKHEYHLFIHFFWKSYFNFKFDFVRLSGNALEYSGHVREIRVSEVSCGIESHVGKTENQECKCTMGCQAPSNALQPGVETRIGIDAGESLI